MHQSTTLPPAFLVELLDLESEDLYECDVTRHLQNALECVLEHLAAFEGRVTPQVTIAPDGEFEGIAFFGPQEQQLAFITGYYLERDTPSCEFEVIRELMEQPISELEVGLKAIFC